MLEGERCSASVVLSGAIKTESYYVQVFCERGVVLVDFDTSAVLITRESSLPRSVRRATSNFIRAWQLSAWGVRNIVSFARGKLVPYQGLQNLIPRFYNSINDQTEPPVSPELAMAVTKVEETVFAQAGKLHVNSSPQPSKQIAVVRPRQCRFIGCHEYGILLRPGIL